MVRLDTFISGIRVGIVLDDVSFELLTHDKKGYIKKLRFSGAYVIVDNGYLDWLYTSHLLEFLTTLTRYVGQNDAERCQVHIRDSKGGIEEIKKWS